MNPGVGKKKFKRFSRKRVNFSLTHSQVDGYKNRVAVSYTAATRKAI